MCRPATDPPTPGWGYGYGQGWINPTRTRTLLYPAGYSNPGPSLGVARIHQTRTQGLHPLHWRWAVYHFYLFCLFYSSWWLAFPCAWAGEPWEECPWQLFE